MASNPIPQEGVKCFRSAVVALLLKHNHGFKFADIRIYTPLLSVFCTYCTPFLKGFILFLRWWVWFCWGGGNFCFVLFCVSPKLRFLAQPEPTLCTSCHAFASFPVLTCTDCRRLSAHLSCISENATLHLHLQCRQPQTCLFSFQGTSNFELSGRPMSGFFTLLSSPTTEGSVCRNQDLFRDIPPIDPYLPSVTAFSHSWGHFPPFLHLARTQCSPNAAHSGGGTCYLCSEPLGSFPCQDVSQPCIPPVSLGHCHLPFWC